MVGSWDVGVAGSGVVAVNRRLGWIGVETSVSLPSLFSIVVRTFIIFVADCCVLLNRKPPRIRAQRVAAVARLNLLKTKGTTTNIR